MVRKFVSPEQRVRQARRAQRTAIGIAGVILISSCLAQAQDEDASDSKLVMKSPAVQTQSPKQKIAGAWRMGLGGTSFANEKDQAQVAGFWVEGKLRYRLIPTLTFRANASAGLQSGYAQSRFGENTPKTGLRLGEAILQYRPVQLLTFQAGAINQDHLESPLLVDGGVFPGALEKISFGNDVASVELKAQQTVPTSTTLSTKAVESEKTPTFSTETLAFKLRPIEILEFTAFGTHYAYRSLPSSVASESEIYGNSVTGSGPASAKFRYEYDGWVAGGSGAIRLTKSVSWKTFGYMIQNTKADETYKNGQAAGTTLKVGLPGDIDMETTGGVFFAESDIAPAFYNSSSLGHTNRQGWEAHMNFAFKQERFKLGADYVQSDVINPNPNQSKQQFIRIRFETMYDVL